MGKWHHALFGESADAPNIIPSGLDVKSNVCCLKLRNTFLRRFAHGSFASPRGRKLHQITMQMLSAFAFECHAHSCPFTYSLTLTHSLTHFTHPLTHSLTHSRTPPTTRYSTLEFNDVTGTHALALLDYSSPTFASSHCRIVALSLVALPHCRIVALSHCRIVALSHCCIVALSHCRIVAIWAINKRHGSCGF